MRGMFACQCQDGYIPFSLLVAPEWISLTSPNHINIDLLAPAYSEALNKGVLYLGVGEIVKDHRPRCVLLKTRRLYEGFVDGSKAMFITQSSQPVCVSQTMNFIPFFSFFVVSSGYDRSMVLDRDYDACMIGLDEQWRSGD